MKTRLHTGIIFFVIAVTVASIHAMEKPAATGPTYSLSRLIIPRSSMDDDMILFVKQVSVRSHCYLVAFSKGGCGQMFDVNNDYTSIRHLYAHFAHRTLDFENIELVVGASEKLTLRGWEEFNKWNSKQYEYFFDIADKQENKSIEPTRQVLMQEIPISSDQMATCNQMWEKKNLSDDIFDTEALTDEQKDYIVSTRDKKIIAIYSWQIIDDTIICGHGGFISIWKRKKTSI